MQVIVQSQPLGTCFIPRRILKLVPNLVQEVSDRLGIENLAPDLASAVS